MPKTTLYQLLNDATNRATPDRVLFLSGSAVGEDMLPKGRKMRRRNPPRAATQGVKYYTGRKTVVSRAPTAAKALVNKPAIATVLAPQSLVPLAPRLYPAPPPSALPLPEELQGPEKFEFTGHLNLAEFHSGPFYNASLGPAEPVDLPTELSSNVVDPELDLFLQDDSFLFGRGPSPVVGDDPLIDFPSLDLV